MVVVQCHTGALYCHHSFDFSVATVAQLQINQPSFLVKIPRPKLLLFPFSTIPPPLLAFSPIQSDSTSFYYPPHAILSYALHGRNRSCHMENLEEPFPPSFAFANPSSAMFLIFIDLVI